MSARREALDAQSSQITDDRARAEAEQETLRATDRVARRRHRSEDGRTRKPPRAREARAGSARHGARRARPHLRGVARGRSGGGRRCGERSRAARATRCDAVRLRTARTRSVRAARGSRERRANGSPRKRATRKRLARNSWHSTRATAAAAGRRRAGRRARRRGRARARRRRRRHTAPRRANSRAPKRGCTRSRNSKRISKGHVPGTRAVLEANARGEFDGIVGVVSNLVRVDERTRARSTSHSARRSRTSSPNAPRTRSARSRSCARGKPAARRSCRSIRSAIATAAAPATRRASRGVIGYAHALVEPIHPRFAGIVAFLVGRILVVESLDVGVRLVRGARFPRRDRHARRGRDPRRRRDDGRPLQARTFDPLAARAGAHAFANRYRACANGSNARRPRRPRRARKARRRRASATPRTARTRISRSNCATRTRASKR